MVIVTSDSIAGQYHIIFMMMHLSCLASLIVCLTLSCLLFRRSISSLSAGQLGPDLPTGCASSRYISDQVKRTVAMQPYVCRLLVCILCSKRGTTPSLCSHEVLIISMHGRTDNIDSRGATLPVSACKAHVKRSHHGNVAVERCRK